MTVTAEWDSPEQNRILITFHRPWTWPEFDTANTRMNTLFRSVTHRVDLVLDISDGGLPPSNAMQKFKQVSENQHLNLGRIVVVGLPGFFRGMLNVIRSVYRGRYEAPEYLFVATLEKARDILNQPVPAPSRPTSANRS